MRIVAPCSLDGHRGVALKLFATAIPIDCFTNLGTIINRAKNMTGVLMPGLSF